MSEASSIPLDKLKVNGFVSAGEMFAEAPVVRSPMRILTIMVVMVILILLMQYFVSTNVNHYNAESQPKAVEAFEDHGDPFYDHKKYDVNYIYEEMKQQPIRTDPGENVLFSTAHMGVMDTYPKYL